MSSASTDLKFSVPDTITKIVVDSNEDKITYQVGKYLGKGGYAKCYKVTDVTTDNTYCAKIILKKIIKNDSHRLFLDREIDVHQKLNHPNVVKFIDTFETTNKWGDILIVILLELCSGGSLRSLLKQKKKFTENEIKGYIKQILTGLSYIHGEGIIHRDIKLGNILLSGNQIKICDFGMAIYISDESKDICGTPNYISPEMLSSKNKQTVAIDMWALGVTIYAMVVGRPPFETADIRTTYRRIRDSIYYFPDSVPLSDHIENLIRGLLQKDPLKRLNLEQIRTHDFLIMDSDMNCSNINKPRSNIVDIVYRKLMKPPDIPDTNIPLPTVWIIGFSISDKHGVFYRLNNGEFGANYNDGSSMITIPPDNIQYTISIQNKKVKKVRELKLTEDYESDTNKKIRLLRNIIKYPHLVTIGNHKVSEISGSGITESEITESEITEVKKWANTPKGTFFRLINDTIQVRFVNETSVILSDKGNVATFIEKDGSMKSYWIRDIPSSRKKHIVYIRNMLKQWIDQRKKEYK